MIKSDDLMQLFDELGGLFDQLILFEEKKVECISQNDIDGLDSSMNEEQALLLKLRGLDQRREKLLTDMGLQDQTFRQLIHHTEGEEQEALQSRFETLSDKTDRLKTAIDYTKKLIELHQHGVETLLNRMSQGSPGTYDPAGSPVQFPGEGRFTPQSV